jgi:hypothetical protein
MTVKRWAVRWFAPRREGETATGFEDAVGFVDGELRVWTEHQTVRIGDRVE